MSVISKKILMSVGVTVGLVASLALGMFSGAYADTSYVTKGTVSALVSCYEVGVFKSPISTTDFTKTTRSSTDIFLQGSQQVYVPIGYSGDTVRTSCKDLIGNMVTSKGLSIPNGANSGTDVNNFLTNLGYTMTSSSGSKNGRCFSVVYEKSYNWTDPDIEDTSETLTTQRLCAEVDNNGKITSQKLTIEDGDKSIIQFQNAKTGSIAIDCKVGGLPGLGDCEKHTFEPGVTKWDDFVEEIRYDLAQHKSQGSDIHPFLGYTVVYQLKGLDKGEIEINDESAEFANAEYVMDGGPNAIVKGTETLAGWATNAKPAFSDDETFNLYQAYLNNYYGADIKCGLTDDQAASLSGNSDYKEINYCTKAGMEVCYARPLKHSASDEVGGVEGVEGVEGGIFGSDCDFGCVTDFMNTHNNESACTAANSGSGNQPKPADKSTGFNGNPTYAEDIVDCNALENVGPMQWFMCPAVNGMQYTANALDSWVEDQLEVKTDLYAPGGASGSGVYEAWGHIRDAANILMAVFLLVIIFSQVTGYGIDNYGIKKMLPRLIVIAIVVNLSYYICELAIDLSNILGVGLRNLFGGIGSAVASPAGDVSYIGGMILGAFGVGGEVAAGASIGVALTGVVGVPIAILIAVAVALILIIVAIFTLFAMLGIRQILVVVCLLLSPLAFVAYVLPNTQHFYKNWWNLFKACLVVFPLCGMFSGISYLLKSTVGNSAELGTAGSLVMMVLPYVVFFLLPMLLKAALSALGKIGGALTSLGGTVRSGAQSWGKAASNVARNTQAYKDRQKDVERARALQRSNRVRSMYGNGEELQRRIADAQARLKANPDDAKAQRDLARAQREQRRFYEAQQTYHQIQAEQALEATPSNVLNERARTRQEALELKNYSDQYTNLTRAQMDGELANAINAYNTEKSDTNAIRLQAAIIAAEGKGMNKEMLAHFGGVKFNSTDDRDAKILSRLAGSSDKVLSQYGIQMSKLAAPGYKHVDVDANGNKIGERDLTDDEKQISLNDFIGSQAEIKLSKVSSDKGSSWLNAANDDTWDAILTANPNAIDTHTLITAATNTTDGKVLTKINQILGERKRAGVQENYSMGTAELAKLKPSTVEMLENTGVYDKAVAAIKNDPNSSANQQILNSMDQEVREKLKLDDASLVQARGMQAGYANKTANDVYEEAAKMNAERSNNQETYMRDITNSSMAAIRDALQSGRLTQGMAHNILTSGDQYIRDRLNNNTELRNMLEAGASGMMPTTSNPTPNIPGGGQLNWGNVADVNRAAQNYRAQAGKMNSDYVAKNSAQVEQEAYEENEFRVREAAKKQAEQQKHDELVGEMKRVADAMERFTNQGNSNRSDDNNGGNGFDQGAGI